MAKPPRFFVQVKLPKCCDKALVLPVYIYRHDPAGGYTLTSGSFTVDLDCLPELTTALQWALKQARDQRLIEQQGGIMGNASKLPWGQKAKKAKDAGSELSVLERKLAMIKKPAPPDPHEALLDWMVFSYGQFSTLDEDELKELLALAKKNQITAGNVVLRVFIKKAAAAHVGDKQKKKYCAIFEKALAKDLHHWGLRKFIRDNGGITRCANGTKPAKPLGLNPFRT